MKAGVGRRRHGISRVLVGSQCGGGHDSPLWVVVVPRKLYVLEKVYIAN